MPHQLSTCLLRIPGIDSPQMLPLDIHFSVFLWHLSAITAYAAFHAAHSTRHERCVHVTLQL